MDLRIDSFQPSRSAETQQQALEQLRRNLEAFAPDGLSLLADDLRAGRVLRGTWQRADQGCVLSYRQGEAGGTHSAAPGEHGHTFIALWDSRWLRAPDVLREVDAEIARRPKPTTMPDPAPTELPAIVHTETEVPCPA